MKATAPILAAVTPIALAAIAACGGGGGATAQPGTRCYGLVEGPNRSVVKIESAANPGGGQITIYSYVDGAEEFRPETTAGRLEPDAFVYADGTRLALTADTLTWPQNSLLEGAVFTATACP